jgi:hypothetical protein
MPFDPVQVGRKLITVGDEQRKTGNKLKHSATELRQIAANLDNNARVYQALDSIKSAARSIRDLMTPVSTALHSIATGLNNVIVPNIDWVKTEFDIPVIGKIKVVTGITRSESRPLSAIGASVETVADNLDNIRGGLGTIADGARDLHDQLPTFKTRILGGADDMENGGQSLIVAGTAMTDAGTMLTR